MFEKYDKNIFDKLEKQHNIIVLVGNGFDVGILKKYNNGKMKGKTSSYKDFYEYIKYYNLCDDDNILYKQMTLAKENPGNNWCDFELTIKRLIEDDCQDLSDSVNEIERCVDEFQAYFTRFLNDLVDADVLLEINKESRDKKFAIQSLGRFLWDLPSNSSLEFPANTDHYHLYNFMFFNFNYTSLLDNYMYLDKGQFDPHKWKSADRHFIFYPKYVESPNPTQWSSYLVTNIVHPHGQQNIPRSILFGVDKPEYNKGNSAEKRLIKSYWARYDVKYKSYFEEAELFIIYGMSISECDGWWMDQIFDAIIKRKAELIIYMYGDEKEEHVKDLFIQASIRHAKATEKEKAQVKARIHVVTFNENNTYFLGIEKKE